MLKKINLLFIVCFFWGWSQDYFHSDIIDGPANVRNSPNGEILFELHDNTPITSTKIDNNWYNIGLFVKISNIGDKNYLYANEPIYNTHEIEIGKIMSKTPIYLKRSEENIGFISGYTFKNNIKNDKSPEFVLKKLIGLTIKKEGFNAFLDEYPPRWREGLLSCQKKVKNVL
jgi:hypothetical protein